MLACRVCQIPLHKRKAPRAAHCRRCGTAVCPTHTVRPAASIHTGPTFCPNCRPAGAPTDTELLDFEEAHPDRSLSKEETIRSELGITPIRYSVRLRRAANTPEAAASHPQLTARLRRRYDQIDQITHARRTR